MTGAVAKRYARALLSVAREEGRLEETGAELERVAVWLDDPELGAVLGSPILGALARNALVAQIARELALSDLSSHFLGLLGQQGRLGEFRNILRVYLRLVDQEAGRVRAIVRSAQPLSEESGREVARALEEISGKTIVLDTEIDATLLGGLTVEMEGRVYDGSVRTHLAALARAMAREAAAE